MHKLWVLSNSSFMEDRVRLSKLKSLLIREGIRFCFVGWLRDDEREVFDYEIRHPFITRNRQGISLSISYLLWSLNLFWFLLTETKKKDCFYAMGLESAFPAYLVSKLRGNQFIFDNPDNFSTSFKLKGILKKTVDKVEKVVASNSIYHILPSKHRVIYSTSKDKFIANTPSKEHILRAKEAIAKSSEHDFLNSISVEKRFKIYLNGRLVDDRGGDYISDVFKQLDPKSFCLVIAGGVKSKKFKRFITSSNLHVYHTNRVPAEISLAAYFFCDVTIALYSPEREINMLAESNKWFDSVTMGTPFISNREIVSLSQFDSNPLCHEVAYGNKSELLERLKKIKKKGEQPINEGLSDWDESVAPLIWEGVLSRSNS